MKIFASLFCFLIFSSFSYPAFANLPYYPIQFPRDEAAHYDNVPYKADLKQMTEWWYYNGTLVSKTGRKMGFYLSYNYMFFAPDKFTPFIQVQFTDIDSKKVYGTQFYFGKGDYSMSTTSLDVTMGKNFTLKEINSVYQVNGQFDAGMPIAFSMQLTPMRSPLFVGGFGLINMFNHKNSYYYSNTELNTSGWVQLGNEIFEIDPIKSLTWMDHQWGDFIIIPDKTQWMWSSVQLENHMEINLSVSYSKKKNLINGFADVVMPNNMRLYLTPADFTYMAHEIPPGQRHPLTYDLIIPKLNLTVTIDALAENQDVNGIWEGVSKVSGTFNGAPIAGQAYTENTIKYRH